MLFMLSQSGSPICLALIETLGNPVLNTSALREGCEAPAACYEVEELFGGQVDLIIDGGEVFPEPSTVISLMAEQPEILRAGKGDTSPFLEKG